MGGRPAMPACPAGQVFFEGPRPAPRARILMAPEAPARILMAPGSYIDIPKDISSPVAS